MLASHLPSRFLPQHKMMWTDTFDLEGGAYPLLLAPLHERAILSGKVALSFEPQFGSQSPAQGESLKLYYGNSSLRISSQAPGHGANDAHRQLEKCEADHSLPSELSLLKGPFSRQVPRRFTTQVLFRRGARPIIPSCEVASQ